MAYSKRVFPTYITTSLFVFLLTLSLQLEASSPREYPMSLGVPLDSRNVVQTGITLNKLGYDLYEEGISPLLPTEIEPFLESAWSVFWTLNLTLWPHDFGHWARANQSGGDFIIEGYAFPLPQAKMVVPESATLWEETLMSSGGFEINTMMRKYTEERYYQSGYRDAEDMLHGFIQTMLFPLYTLAIAPVNTSDPSSWYGDPIQYTELVFENYTGRSPYTNNVTDSGMVSLYNEIFWVNLISIAIDPWMYSAAKVFTVDLKKRPQMKAFWLYESEVFSWTYTTRFNPGVLGYEVYLTQHMKVFDKYFSFYIRKGRPFKNNGVGFRIPEVISVGDFSLDTTFDVWEQDNYGTGGMIGISPIYTVSQNLNLSIDLHWKSKGYVVGLPTDMGLGVLLNGMMSW